MQDLQSQVAFARRRLILDRATRVFGWALLASLSLAVIGVAIPKLWSIGVPGHLWARSWIAGSLLLAVLASLIIVGSRAATSLDAALEIDRRFGLKERISSGLSLDTGSRETPAGQALLGDAEAVIRRIDLREKFGLRPGGWTLLPLLPAGVILLLVLWIPDADAEPSVAEHQSELREQIERSTDELAKRLAQRREQAAELGLADVEQVFEQLEQQTEQLRSRPAQDRKKALAQLNDMAESVKQRRQALGDPAALRRQLEQLGELEAGPAGPLARELTQGNFARAERSVRSLMTEIDREAHDTASQQRLSEQLQEIGDRISELAAANRALQANLQRESSRLDQAGDVMAAERITKQLSNLQAQAQALQQLGNQLTDAAQADNPGDRKRSLDAVAQSLSQMQAEARQLQMLNEALQQLSQSRHAMTCPECGGRGCASCQGASSRDVGSQDGMGSGRGFGERPETKTAADFTEQRLPSAPGQGNTAITGLVEGPSRAGNAVEEIKAAIASGSRDADDPLTGTRLPRDDRQHAQQYFDAIRQAGSEDTQ